VVLGSCKKLALGPETASRLFEKKVAKEAKGAGSASGDVRSVYTFFSGHRVKMYQRLDQLTA
jgi:hypothetical protein